MLGTVGGREQLCSRKALPGTGLPEGKALTRLESGFSSEGTGELSKNVEQRSDTVSINLNSQALYKLSSAFGKPVAHSR